MTTSAITNRRWMKPPAIPATRPAVHATRTQAPAAIPEPRKHGRAGTRTSAIPHPAQSLPAQVLSFVERTEIVAEVQWPDATDIFADPAKTERPCLVEAPADFLAQFDKMVEDSL